MYGIVPICKLFDGGFFDGGRFLGSRSLLAYRFLDAVQPEGIIDDAPSERLLNNAKESARVIFGNRWRLGISKIRAMYGWLCGGRRVGHDRGYRSSFESCEELREGHPEPAYRTNECADARLVRLIAFDLRDLSLRSAASVCHLLLRQILPFALGKEEFSQVFFHGPRTIDRW